jgi:hypothetical protein
MKIIIQSFLFLILAICFSCEEQGLIVKCQDCTTEEPVNTDLDIKLDVSLSGTATLITVYEGNLEDNVVYSSKYTSGSFTSVSVTLNKKFTVTATYSINSKTFIAVDSATPRVRFEKDQCDEPCYFVYDRICDLRLKYTK